MTWKKDRIRSPQVRKVNATFPKHIVTNPIEASTWKVPETFFSHSLTIDTLSKTVKNIDLGFFQRKETMALIGQLWQASSMLCAKNMKAPSLLVLGKK